VTGGLDAVVARVRDGVPRLGATRLVVVDGPAGSGKTTYAGSLARALGGAPEVHLDDLYEGWGGLGPDLYRRLVEDLLHPLAAGRAGGYHRYDWTAGRFAEWHDIASGDLLVLEGVGAAGRPVEPWPSLRVWVEAPAALRLERGVARDGEAMRAQWLRWRERESAHFAADETRARADLVIDGSA
jgi:uridine kinase